jgi:hypothetical protein
LFDYVFVMSNPYIAELIARIDRRFNVDSAAMTLGDWICANTTLRGQPFSFDRYPFQKAIADDLHNNIDVIKPSQIGLTEVQIRKALSFAARYRGTSSIFTLPTDVMFKRISPTRIKPIVDEDKCFNLETRTGEKPVRSMGLIQIGTSFVYVTGASEGAATSISADAVFNDELDLSDQKMIALFNSRLQNSDWKISQRFSTPTFTNYAIDKGFQSSNQFEYLCRCAACRHWQAPTFKPHFIHLPGLSADLNDLSEIDTQMLENGLDLQGAYVKCERCGTALPLGDTDYREWVPRYPTRDHHHGYRVSPFSTDRLTIGYIVQQLLRYKERDFMRGWYNTVLGEAYTDGSSRLSDADINACFTASASIPEIDPHKPTWIGIDMGQTCHAVVAQGDTIDSLHCVRFVNFPVSHLQEWVGEMLATYNVIGGSCDRHPYTPTADELRAISEGRIIPCEYRGQKPMNFIKDVVTDEVSHIQVNRTRAADQVARVIRNKRIRFSGYGLERSTITEHLKDMVRDENPEVEARWVKLTGNDHYFHAVIFLLIGVEMKATQESLFSDIRTTVGLMAVDVIGSNNTLFGISKKAQGLWQK